jgi:hypothetical protein
MPLNKPIIGQTNWGPTLNDALDYLDAKLAVTGPTGPTGPAGAGGDLVVPVSIKDSEDEDFLTFSRTGTGTARIATPQDDLSLRSARDITLIAGDDGPGNVYIGWGDATIAPDATNRVATIADVTAATGLGDITFDGVGIIGAGTASGDGNEYGTIELVPDESRAEFDQYLIIDPTAPNHIHIRAGGEQDASSADLILGGERNNVYVSDNGRSVSISARPAQVISSYVNENPVSNAEFIVSNSANIYEGDEFSYPAGEEPGIFTVSSVAYNTPSAELMTVTATGLTFVSGGTYVFTHEEPWNYQWGFTDTGYLYGPAMGGLYVSGILNNESDLWLASNNNIVLSAEDGEFLGDPTNAENQIATIGDFGYLEISSATDPEEGPLTTLTAPSNLTIQTGGEPAGEITIQADKGLRINYSPEIGGAYLNGNEEYPETQIATLGDIGVETSFTVVGGTAGTQPTFTGDPLFTGSYVKMSSDLVHFQAQVDMDNITSFGTGQYYVTLPFPAKYGYKFREGCLHDISTGRDYEIGGHVYAGSSTLTLTSTDTQSGAVFDIPFTATAPITLAVADNFHIAGTYIADTEAP